jgi:hypothetical protein
LLKLEATAAYLLVGQPFKTYKDSLHAFLYPDSAISQALNENTTEAKAPSDELPPVQLYRMHTGGNEIVKSPTQSHYPPSQIAVESASEFELIRETSSKLCGQTLEEGFLDRPAADLSPNLPMFVDSLLRSVPLLYFEPPIPSGMVRARWTCVSCLLPSRLRVTDLLDLL